MHTAEILLPPSPPAVKHCRRCSTTKSLSDFYREATRPGGYQIYCKPCRRDIKGITQRQSARLTAAQLRRQALEAMKHQALMASLRKTYRIGSPPAWFRGVDCLARKNLTERFQLSDTNFVAVQTKEEREERRRQYKKRWRDANAERLNAIRKSQPSPPRKKRISWKAVDCKTCPKCRWEKPAVAFGISKNNPDGRAYQCKRCVREEGRNRREEIFNDPSKLGAKRKRDAAYVKNKMQNNSLFAMRVRVGQRTRLAIQCAGFTKKKTTREMLGCTFAHFKKHIEKQFTKGMKWSNRIDWHLDHIVPLSSAKTEQELLDLAHYTNVRPLWKKENLQKSNRLVACQPELPLKLQ